MSDLSALESIFFLALATPPDQRAAFLDDACGGDDELRRRVEKMLAAHEEAGSFLEAPPAAAIAQAEPTIDQNSIDRVGTQIGPYKLLQQIGEGGFGVVYMAEQLEPVRRKVALKVIKPGMDTRQVIARFEAERQALAVMDHPHIAKVLDAGTTESGRPYFVMELVRGIPITQYCDDSHLPIRERLELFASVCQAIQHAHTKRIIHRDIKPTNVLVTRQDDQPVVKIIDFGVAKAMGQALTDKTLFTEFAQMIGTPLYMSPEQAELSSTDIDTRSDIYSLGVLLYELLTGSTPVSKEQLKQAAFDEIRRIIREDDPPKPSTRISSAEAAPNIAAQRHTEPAKLTRLVRGELDWIVMKALEKDRSRRYETASMFAKDIVHYLTDEPVLACPPSAAYRLRKFMRRNKGPVLATSLVVLALVCGIIGTTLGLMRAQQRADDERRARQEAQKREAETKALFDFVERRILAAARPAGQDGMGYVGLGYDVSLRQAIDAALPFVEKSFRDQPLIEARMRISLGWSLVHTGEYQAAADQFQASRTIYAKQLGPDHLDTLGSVTGLACSYGCLGRNAEAFKLFEETLALRKVKNGHDHPDTLWAMHFLALSHHRLGQNAEAARLNQETLDLRKAKLGPDNQDTLWSMNNLALSYSALGRHAEAQELNERTLALRKAKLGADHPDTLQSMCQLADCFSALGQHTESRELNEKTLELRKTKLGPDHPDTLGSMSQLAASLHELGQNADALKLWEQTLPLKRKKLGADHPDTLWTLHMLANSYEKLKQHDKALKTRQQVLMLTSAKVGPDDPDTLYCMQQVAVSLIALRKNDEALKLLQETLELRRNKLGPDHIDTFWTMAAVAERLVMLGRGAEALPLIDECVQKAGDEPVCVGMVPSLLLLRFQHFKKLKDCAGVRGTAEMWEKLNRSDANSLYNAACMRAVTAAILTVDPKIAGADATKIASEEADRAMAWLHKAVTAGFKDAGHMVMDTDLEALRGREDFEKMLAELEGKMK